MKLLIVAAVFTVGWAILSWPPRAPETSHRWQLELQNGDKPTIRADHISTVPDPVLSGYFIVTAIDAVGDTVGRYSWVYKVHRLDSN